MFKPFDAGLFSPSPLPQASAYSRF